MKSSPPLSKAIHLPALFLQARWLHFRNSWGLGSWSHRHRSWSSVLLSSEETQWTVLFWKPPPQEAVHWRREGAESEFSRRIPRAVPIGESLLSEIFLKDSDNKGANNLEKWISEESRLWIVSTELGLIDYCGQRLDCKQNRKKFHT